jgi:uroporphyrinogen-III synthase
VTRRVLVLRPEPGAGETAARARRLGLEPAVAPLFDVRAVAWDAPEPAGFDAMLFTSANAPRHAGPDLRRFSALRCYAVGDATAAAAAASGFAEVRIAGGSGVEAVAMLERDVVGRALHLCGRDHRELASTATAIERCVVYASDAAAALPAAAVEAIAAGAVALVHSPRAGALFARLCDAAGLDRDAIRIAAISPAAAAAAGGGWRAREAAERPRDEALLELAAKLCQKRSPEER